MNKGIKEIEEIFNALDVIAKAGGSAYKDKKIDLKDLPILMEIAMNANTLLEGFKGLSEAVGEAKDLDGAEQMMIINRFFQVAQKYEAGRTV